MAAPVRPRGSGSAGGIRRYGEDDVRRLRFIKGAQGGGFTVAEIRELLSLYATNPEASRARAGAQANSRARRKDCGLEGSAGITQSPRRRVLGKDARAMSDHRIFSERKSLSRLRQT
jgi:MerR family transcriptional regulator, mercuric resistance operon regulatory protein